MIAKSLQSAVQNFAHLFMNIPDADLERAWAWKDHDEEGIRFACFVTLQELRDLAVILAALRPRPTPAQHILSQYHAAYMDLQAALLGVTTADADRAPAEGEWSVRRTYAHILATDIGFIAVVRYALEGHRAQRWTPDRIPDEEYPRLYCLSEQEYDSLMEGPWEGMRAYHRELHRAIIEEFSNITNEELELPSTFWEETRFPIKHRLHRYEAHFAQHTIQIDKTLVALGQASNESKRLLRKIYAALAEAEGMMIGVEKTDETAILATVSLILERTRELENLLEPS